MHLEELRTHYRNQILAVAAKHKADNVRVFGSVARGDATEKSDVDLLVHFREGASLFDEAGLDMELNALLGRKVDVIGDDAIREELKPFILSEAVPL